jgi:hypothetical protein
MPKKQDRHKNVRGLISDTLEMPALNPEELEKQHSTAARQARRRRQYRTMLILAFAVFGSFVLGFAVRIALHIAPEINIFSTQNTQEVEVPPQNIMAPGRDIIDQLNEVIEFTMSVGQVMPFNVAGGSIKYTVLGGYLLGSNGNEDRTKPVMAVIPVRILEQTVSEKDMVTISGKVAMINENAAVAELTEEQEKDLNYIVERVNYWDRATVFVERVRLQEE